MMSRPESRARASRTPRPPVCLVSRFLDLLLARPHLLSLPASPPRSPDLNYALHRACQDPRAEPGRRERRDSASAWSLASSTWCSPAHACSRSPHPRRAPRTSSTPSTGHVKTQELGQGVENAETAHPRRLWRARRRARPPTPALAPRIPSALPRPQGRPLQVTARPASQGRALSTQRRRICVVSGVLDVALARPSPLSLPASPPRSPDLNYDLHRSRQDPRVKPGRRERRDGASALSLACSKSRSPAHARSRSPRPRRSPRTSTTPSTGRVKTQEPGQGVEYAETAHLRRLSRPRLRPRPPTPALAPRVPAALPGPQLCPPQGVSRPRSRARVSRTQRRRIRVVSRVLNFVLTRPSPLSLPASPPLSPDLKDDLYRSRQDPRVKPGCRVRRDGASASSPACSTSCSPAHTSSHICRFLISSCLSSH